LFLIFDS